MLLHGLKPGLGVHRQAPGGKPTASASPQARLQTFQRQLPPGSVVSSSQAFVQFSSVQSLSCVQLFSTPWTAARQASLSITNSQSLLKLVHCIGDTIQPSHPLSSPSPSVFNLSQHWCLFPVSQLFSSGGQNIGASASASVLPMNIQY